MTEIAQKLDALGYYLRSGGAPGADTAFEDGAVFDDAQIFLPWRGFNGRKKGIVLSGDIEQRAASIAKDFHPVWDRLTQGARRLHTRNVPQILGPDLQTPSEFVVCWTKDGRASGGTGQAIRIAEALGVLVYNIKRQSDLAALREWLRL